ncbi:iron chelate uptake ABC transporter family permease subunit [Symbiobacterium thermophilum]|uniref:Ferrichrome ABC transporter permease protein n=1 Tax=Symbiobacterium thermophilum (strain DSM 24528 / JCM 14929 / IAM 14863 / T) TaxID=292459 RepID=Q67P06_SYMTH|nr:iron chelate uptake ABC transporter family permease subunit [Symbiobacterium thermophilum]BAD40587.1 ferrichrome ABC transporter permease protein [Symbiobacterium thermophilum IAM 14863]
MKHKRNLIILGILLLLALTVVGLYLFVPLRGNIQYILRLRTHKVLAMALTGTAIAYATVVFQTITNNRILTPSIIGMDSVYQLFQTIMVFFWGSTALQFVDQQINFLITVTLMIGFALLLYQVLFRKDGTNLHFLLLMGIVMGTLFGSLTTFLQVLIDPNEYAGLQSRLFASVSRVNTNLLFLGGGLMIPVMLYGLRYVRTLDAIALGRDHAINLGVDYGPVLRRMLIVVAVLMAAATALVGPITFLGLLVANISYHLLDTYRRGPLIAAAVAVGVVFLVGAQLIMERVLAYSTPVSVIVNFIGGMYFLYLVLKERTAW